MNYKTCTLEELVKHIDSNVKTACISLADSPTSKIHVISSTVGFFQGVCLARGLEYDYYATIRKWLDLI